MAEPKTRPGGDPLNILGGALGDLHFHWQTDRYQHAWKFAGDSTTELSSIESPSATTWPISPPLQQIHQQSFPDGREVIFGVGMAGRGHWSASFTLVPDLKCWIVELACRSSVAAESLSSSYRGIGHWKTNASAGVECMSGDTRISLEALSSAALSIQDDNISIVPTTTPTAASTLQWAFRLRVG